MVTSFHTRVSARQTYIKGVKGNKGMAWADKKKTTVDLAHATIP